MSGVGGGKRWGVRVGRAGREVVSDHQVKDGERGKGWLDLRVKLLRFRAAIHTMRLSPKNIFVEIAKLEDL